MPLGSWRSGGLLLAALFLSAAGDAPTTAEQDHQDMMRQLGIVQLRPGLSGDPDAPNAANYDPAKANPYPVWPDLMTMADGRPVTSAAMWKRERRPELVELFEREVTAPIVSSSEAGQRSRNSWSATSTTERRRRSRSI
ncbi:hypothetical protein [Sphingomonas phyllosphaerae]|uniref:hypothetical protein n=1 Tax=Sphingomonas phyllosphaerae TaxID=257003 RepID=UPI00241359C9|nr:hypothetical protein [Sphingomonas phyllosphaerae]